MIAIVLLILWYTGFFKKEKNTATGTEDIQDNFRAGVAAAGGDTSDFSAAAGHYDSLYRVQNADVIAGCALIEDVAASAALNETPPRNPCLDSNINTDNPTYKTLVKGSYKVDITNSFVVSQGGTLPNGVSPQIEQTGTYCCQDAAKAALQDNALLHKFAERKGHALNMKEAATAGANSLATAAGRAASSLRQYETRAQGFI